MNRTSPEAVLLSRDHLVPLKVAIGYALVAGAWILLSDELLLLIVRDAHQLSHFQTAKGWFFVLTTALLLYVLVRHYLRAVYRRETQLRASEERFRSVFLTAAAGMAVMHPNGEIIQANPAFCRFIGYSEKELVGMTIADITHPDDRELTRENYRSLSAGEEESIHYEKRYLTRDGRTVWGNASVACLLGHDNIPGYCIGLVQDITRSKQAEEDLLAARLQLEEIIDFLPDATFVIDRDGRVVAWNRAIERMTGVPKEKMLCQGDFAYAVPFYGERRPMLLDLIESPDLVEEGYYDAIGNGGESLEKYLPLLYGGTGAHVWATASQLLDREGNTVGAIETIRDITDRKEARERLETANRELEAFVYTVSHDLRSLLTPIIGFADYLFEHCRDRLSEQELACLSEISISGERMMELMEDLLTLAKVGQVERPGEPVDSVAVVNEVVSGLALQILQSGATVEVGTIPSLLVPKSLVAQIFDNLIGNGLRYGCPEGGVIEVGGERRGATVRLYVRDHGPGIPDEERGRIFEVFYRGSTGTHKKGTGIGLATVQKIAKLFSGRAWVEETPGGGSTFWVEMVDVPPP